MIDLHTHSTYSDGVLAPSQLVHKAADEGITVLALADHDSVDGIREAQEAGKVRGVQIIQAVELSVVYRQFSDMHLLGYGINHGDLRFNEHLRLFRTRRDTRSEAIIEQINKRLQQQGRKPISSGEVSALADGAIGRPHIARVLIDYGYVQNMETAFTDFLVPCNIPKEYFPFEDALREIHRIGGIAVLAHPTSVSNDFQTLARTLHELIQHGLDGIEVFHNMVSPSAETLLSEIAQKKGLVVTGGSDFHGIEENEVLGMIHGNRVLQHELAERLQAAISSLHSY